MDSDTFWFTYYIFGAVILSIIFVFLDAGFIALVLYLLMMILFWCMEIAKHLSRIRRLLEKRR